MQVHHACHDRHEARHRLCGIALCLCLEALLSVVALYPLHLDQVEVLRRPRTKQRRDLFGQTTELLLHVRKDEYVRSRW